MGVGIRVAKSWGGTEIRVRVGARVRVGKSWSCKK